MAKAVVQHVCSECGTTSPRWLGRCPGCGGWGTLLEERAEPAAAVPGAAARPLLRLVDVATADADRLGGGAGVRILAETNLDAVCATLERERPEVCVIDSVQTLYDPALGSAPGSVAQVREAAGRLLRLAKEQGIATLLVGHVTKDGAVAGPRVLEHPVGCVLHFEGDRYRPHPIPRAG